MSERPDALRLADELEDEHYPWPRFPAAAELRRLHAQRDALLEALKGMLLHMGMDEDEWNKPTFDFARAAIAKAEEQT